MLLTIEGLSVVFFKNDFVKLTALGESRKDWIALRDNIIMASWKMRFF